MLPFASRYGPVTQPAQKLTLDPHQALHSKLNAVFSQSQSLEAEKLKVMGRTTQVQQEQGEASEQLRQAEAEAQQAEREFLGRAAEVHQLHLQLQAAQGANRKLQGEVQEAMARLKEIKEEEQAAMSEFLKQCADVNSQYREVHARHNASLIDWSSFGITSSQSASTTASEMMT